MTEISGKSMEEIYREEARRYKESIEKERVFSESEDILTGNFDKSKCLTVTMPMEEFDKLEKLALSAHTDKLSVEKLQEIRVEELKDFNSKILQAELKNQKLQKEIDAAKKYIEESYKADKEDDKLLDLIIEDVAKLKSDNETAKKNIEHVIGTIKHDGHLGTIQTDWILTYLEKTLAAIGWGGCPVGAVGKNGLTKEEIEGSGDE
jgi:hypothetical protein